MAAVVAFGLFAFAFAQPERRQNRRRLRITTGCFATAVAATLALSVLQWNPQVASVSVARPQGATLAQVLALVKASNKIENVPADLEPPVAVAVTKPLSNWGASRAGSCGAQLDESTVPACVFGDTRASRTAVLYGDSHAQMWFDAIDDLAIRDGWKLVLLSKGACAASPIVGFLAASTAGGARACKAWHPYALKRINALDPDLLIVTQEVYAQPDGAQYTNSQWRRALAKLLREVHAKRTVVLGNIPLSFGPSCLERSTVTGCSTQRNAPAYRFTVAEQAAAQASGDQYVRTTPWFCAARCSPIIGHFNVYFDEAHVGLGYTEYLEGVLGQALGL